MPTESPPACEHGIPAHTLSAWRDGDLPAGEAQRITAHIAECAASRARLADYDALLQAMRAQRVPPADERLWPAVRMRISQTRAGTPMHTGNTARRLLGALGALAAVPALLPGFSLVLPRGLWSLTHGFITARCPTTPHPPHRTGAG